MAIEFAYLLSLIVDLLLIVLIFSCAALLVYDLEYNARHSP